MYTGKSGVFLPDIRGEADKWNWKPNESHVEMVFCLQCLNEVYCRNYRKVILLNFVGYCYLSPHWTTNFREFIFTRVVL